MNQILNRKFWLLLLTVLLGLGMAFVLPVLVKAQRATISIQSPVVHSNAGRSDPGSIEFTCTGFPMTVADESELNNAIGCYNALAAAGN